MGRGLGLPALSLVQDKDDRSASWWRSEGLFCPRQLGPVRRTDPPSAASDRRWCPGVEVESERPAGPSVTGDKDQLDAACLRPVDVSLSRSWHWSCGRAVRAGGPPGPNHWADARDHEQCGVDRAGADLRVTLGGGYLRSYYPLTLGGAQAYTFGRSDLHLWGVTS